MGFAPPPSANLQPYTVQPAQNVDPLQTLAQMRELRTQGIQQQSAQLALQQAQLKQESQRQMIQAFIQGGNDPDKVLQAAIASGKVLPEDITTLQTHMVKLKSDVAALDEKNRKMLGEDIDNYQGLLSGVKDQAGLDTANQAALKRGLFQSGKFDPLQTYDKDHLQAYVNSLSGMGTILGRKKEEAQTEEASAKGAQARAEAKLKDLDTQLTQHKLDLYNTLKGTPQALAQRVAKSVDPNKYPDLYARAINEAGNQADLEGINKAIEKYAGTASELEKETTLRTDPTILQSQLTQDVKKAKALAPIETARSVATAVATEKAKAALSPEGFSQITDPTARNKAMTQAQLVQNDYINKSNDAQKMLDMIDSARAGNQSASSMIPLAEVRAWVNRVNTQELNSVAGGVSALRKVENWLSSATEGRMSEDTLKDLQQLGELQQAGARRAYDAGRRGVKGLYGVMPPDVGATSEIAPAARGAKPLIKTKAEFDALPSGALYTEADGKTYRKP